VKDITVDRVGPEHADWFTNIAADVFDEAIDPERLSLYLRAPDHLMVLARDGALVVGQVAAVIHRHPDKPPELYIDEVGVTGSHLRQGIAGRMVEAMLAIGRAAGCEECWLGTEPDNLAARALYKRWAEAKPIVMYQFDL